MRAGLTMLGIIIGIGAVIAMVSLGQGATAAVQDEIASLGTNVLIIVPGATSVGGVRGGLGTISTLTVDDAEDIQSKVDGVTTVLYDSRSVLQAISGIQNWSTVVLGTTPEFIDVRSWPMAKGNFFTQSDMNSAAKIVVLGKTVVQNLFEPGEEVVGSQSGSKVSAPRHRRPGTEGQSIGQDQDDLVVLPFSTAERKVLGTQFLGAVGIILVSARSQTRHIPAIVDDIKDLLRADIGCTSLRTKQLYHPYDGRDRETRSLDEPHNDVYAYGDRIHFPDCRRHRHHEHSPGLSDRTDKGDRFAHGRRRKTHPYPAAIPD